ncbi:GNAT family N-acetyltransferase [Herbiconiux sp. CPCC 205763]|uniref:GNAT family N-acetyltransferase n=1 Tax=Herbiconiux aconitum TaxID=2970913 RepID=A0ABT2GUV4_9MICO|nr:GNAT family N-acetyltransferase [Herbiconiux aconitum]MCS5718714.1 GNAT family N-acetyltransferase [Herbiconiux aconitum]
MTADRIERVDPSSDDARDILRLYYGELVGRYHGRDAEPVEVEQAMADEPSDDLVGETGLFVIARDAHGVAMGCGGLRFVDARVAELTRVFVAPAGRGSGTGSLVVSELEHLARLSGRQTIRLDTRRDLVEARRLYARLGYQEVPAFNDDPYAEHWFSKSIVATG